MASTLLLDRSATDLCLTAGGNIAVASEPYSQAQDAASECRVFEGEEFYSISEGLPYLDQILGQQQPIQIFRAKAIAAALKVPGVTDAQVFITGFRNRELVGQLQITTQDGVQGVEL